MMRKPPVPPRVEELLEHRPLDLTKAFVDAQYRQFLARSTVGYWHWHKVRFIARSAGLDPEVAWALIKLTRMQQYRSLPLVGYKASDPLVYMLPAPSQRELMLIDQQLAGGLSTETERPLSTGQRERYVINALQDEAIASSMLEGAVTTRRDAKQLLRSGRRPRSHGERMVVNNYRTIMFIRETRGIGLSPDYLLEIQKLLTDGTLEDSSHAGRFRTDSDDVRLIDDRDNEIMHVPPSADELPHRLRDLCSFANSSDDEENAFVHPVVRACVLHFQIGFDHPFCDGNGRTARAVFYWYLLRRGYWLFEFLPISPMYVASPGRYSRAYLYAETDGFDVTYFLQYNLRLISRAREAFRDYLSKKQRQLAEAHRLFKADPQLNHRQQEVLLKIARNPDLPLTIHQHQGIQGIAYATARSDLLDLAEREYLKRDLVGNKYVFSAGHRLTALGDRARQGRIGAEETERPLLG